MNNILNQVGAVLTRARSGHVPPPLVAELPPGHCLPPGIAGSEIRRDRDYFTVTIHELGLAANRQWWAHYDPMVLAVTELTYGGAKITVPAIVGPETIRSLQPAVAVPAGVVLRETPVAGPYPYRGGTVALTVMLYRVKVGDHAQRILKVLEGLTQSVGVVDVAMMTKVGGAVVNGLDTLLDLGQTVPVAGQRIVLDGDTFRGFRNCFSVLVAEQDTSQERLRVVEGGRLHVATDEGSSPFNAADYVLYSVQGRARRGEITTLPFSKLLTEARKAASTGEAEGWKRAKASLLAFYQEMVGSPDLTVQDAEAILQEQIAELKSIERVAKDANLMAEIRLKAPDAAERARLNGATALLDLS